MSKSPRSSIYYTLEQADKLRTLAQEYGYFQKRGVGTGKIGSISQLVKAIADGEMKIARKESDNAPDE